jgi:hypothetical protein
MIPVLKTLPPPSSPHQYILSWKILNISLALHPSESLSWRLMFIDFYQLIIRMGRRKKEGGWNGYWLFLPMKW